MRTEITGEQLSVWFDREESYRVSAWWDRALIDLLCASSGCAPGDARRTRHRLADEVDPSWREEWVTPSGAKLEYAGEGIMSPHGCHGQAMRARVTGLPVGVTLSARWHCDHRSGGSLLLRLEGVAGLAALETQLRAEVA